MEAVKWYRLAADQAYVSAMYHLGRMYENGFGVTKDLEEAARWYSLAAEQGNPDAQTALERLKG